MSKRRTSKKKEQEDGGVLPKIELLFIFIFFLVFITWAMSKCGSVQTEYAKEENGDVTTTEAIEKPEPKAKSSTTETVDKPTAKKVIPPVKVEKRTILYVLLDGLKLRKDHHLDSAIVKTLKINDEVYFLGETTNFKQRINLGDRIAVEPWIKVRTYTGHEGWVYGAGVHYFKPKAIIDTLGN